MFHFNKAKNDDVMPKNVVGEIIGAVILSILMIISMIIYNSSPPNPTIKKNFQVSQNDTQIIVTYDFFDGREEYEIPLNQKKQKISLQLTTKKGSILNYYIYVNGKYFYESLGKGSTNTYINVPKSSEEIKIIVVGDGENSGCTISWKYGNGSRNIWNIFSRSNLWYFY